MADLNRGAGVTDAPVKPSEILDKAADQIDRRGWVQDDWWEADTPTHWTDCKVCAGGGINAAAGWAPDFDGYDRLGAEHPAARAVIAFADRVAPDRESPAVDWAMALIIRWNDEEGRTATEVVRELRAVAASEREAGR